MRSCTMPVGFAHGFCVLSRVARRDLQADAPYYDPPLREGLRGRHGSAIDWPLSADELIVSERDSAAPDGCVSWPTS